MEGRAALREYFRRGVQAFPNRHFGLIDVLWAVQTIVVYYQNNVRGNKAAEVIELTTAVKIHRIWANYDQ